MIQKGDTLWGISRRYGVTVEAIQQANGLTSTNIREGKTLVIPAR
jgi:LysM repeat protein